MTHIVQIWVEHTRTHAHTYARMHTCIPLLPPWPWQVSSSAHCSEQCSPSQQGWEGILDNVGTDVLLQDTHTCIHAHILPPHTWTHTVVHKCMHTQHISDPLRWICHFTHMYVCNTRVSAELIRNADNTGSIRSADNTGSIRNADNTGSIRNANNTGSINQARYATIYNFFSYT